MMLVVTVFLGVGGLLFAGLAGWHSARSRERGWKIALMKKTITEAALACPTCHGGGTLSMPGATRRCSYCYKLRELAGFK